MQILIRRRALVKAVRKRNPLLVCGTIGASSRRGTRLGRRPVAAAELRLNAVQCVAQSLRLADSSRIILRQRRRARLGLAAYLARLARSDRLGAIVRLPQATGDRLEFIDGLALDFGRPGDGDEFRFRRRSGAGPQALPHHSFQASHPTRHVSRAWRPSPTRRGTRTLFYFNLGRRATDGADAPGRLNERRTVVFA
jgi:hypothetical protein